MESRSPTSSSEVALGALHEPAADAGDSLPGVVLVHDVWGRSAHSRELATELAAAGFAVLEVDLYRELGPVEIEDPGRFIRGLSDPQVLADLDAGGHWLMAQGRSRGRKVGVVGVCMGGSYSLLAACLSEVFSAAAPFYGILSYDRGMLADPAGRDLGRKPHAPLEVGERLRMPLLAAFGAEDPIVPQADVDALESALERSGMRFQVDRYPGAGHAFLNRTRPDAHRPAAAAEAWQRLVSFLQETLA